MRKVDIPSNAYICIHYSDIVSKGLKGNELLVYSLIFGFTQDGNGKAIDTAYICEFLQISDKSIREILNKLVDKGIIEREDVEFGYTTKAVYKVAMEESSYTLEETSTPPGRNFHTNNINNNIKENNNIINNIIIKESEAKPKKKAKEFVKPTLAEVEQYIKEKNYTINAKYFYDYYEAKDWEGMKNWKLTVVTWENSPYNKNKKETTNEVIDNEPQSVKVERLHRKVEEKRKELGLEKWQIDDEYEFAKKYNLI